ALQAKREAADARREAARERRAEALQAKREAADARREAADAKREAAREKKALAKAEREAAAAAKANSLASNPRHGGILRINSLPWSQVYIDGQMVGYTPQRAISLAPGEHAVRLINPEFAMSKTLQVRIAKGQQITRSEVLSE
ncbi:MAG TPA: PEGA domain-containing protein, partial [Polyangiales bacterium]|nr:PEGA domain-containing protein [Polyangiales bacterium]